MKITPEEHKKMIELRKQGFTCVEIAKHMGVSKSFVSLCTKASFENKPTKKELVRKMFSEGKTKEDIALELGLTVKTVMQYSNADCTEEDYVEMKRMLIDGYALREIAEKYHVSVNYVRFHTKEQNFKMVMTVFNEHPMKPRSKKARTSHSMRFTEL